MMFASKLFVRLIKVKWWWHRTDCGCSHLLEINRHPRTSCFQLNIDKVIHSADSQSTLNVLWTKIPHHLFVVILSDVLLLSAMCARVCHLSTFSLACLHFSEIPKRWKCALSPQEGDERFSFWWQFDDILNDFYCPCYFFFYVQMELVIQNVSTSSHLNNCAC